MAFAAIRLGAGGPVLAVGRDLRAIAAIQQRFVEAQQELERDYWKQRQAESRYRLLFQVATDAVLVVDALTLSIVEANHSAAALFGATPEQLAGRQASAAIDPLSRPAVDELLVTARASGRPAEIRARLARRADATGTALVDVSATPFRATVDGASVMLLLVRARGSAPRSGDPAQQLAEFVEHTPDAVAITDSSGRVQMANPAFLTLCRHGSTENRIKGLALGEALGDPGLRLGPLVGEVRRLGIATRVRARIGGAGVDGCEVEVSAALLAEGDQECIGFTLRRLGLPRTTGDLPALEGLAQAIDGLAEQLGRVSLPELMQEASHLAERHLILGALQQARGRLADAADWLGITPDSLGLRLRRHGLTAAAGQHQPPSLLN
jgi:transcriptional regulator PpsR